MASLVLALPVHTFALGIFTPATVHQGIRREDTTYQNHSFIIQNSCLVCWTCMLWISECSIYSARIALFLKFIFKGAGLWILKKLSLNNFLSLSTAYNCMCYSSNGNYNSFKYQARSTNTPLLLHIKKYEFRKKALTHYISNMLKIWRKLTKWTFIGTLHSPSPSWIDTHGSRIFMIFFNWIFCVCNSLSGFIPPLHRLGYWRLANSPISPYICQGLKGNVRRSFSNQNVYI